MTLLLHRSAGIALRLIVAAACCYGIWSSLQFARADSLYRLNTEESLRTAIQLVPDGYYYYMQLALFDRKDARELLETSLRLNPYNAQEHIELGLELEAEGDLAKAEKQLLGAYEVDHTYLPRWSLANFYFRQDNIPAFWEWARSAAQMPADEIGPLFELCWRVSPDPAKITEALLNEKPELIRQYIGFLLAKNQLPAVAVVAPHLVSSGDSDSDRPLIFAVINRLVADNNAPPAIALWRSMIEKHWVLSDATVPNNAEFSREPLPVSFDWSLPEYQGLHSWPGSSGLESEFTGSQPEECTVAEQAIVLKPGNYEMSYAYHTSAIAPGTGIRWQIVDVRSNAVIAESPDLSSDQLQHSKLAFTVPPDASLLRLRLGYRRALGTPRVSGTLVVLSSEIKAVS